jgi:hypothetical protein
MLLRPSRGGIFGSLCHRNPPGGLEGRDGLAGRSPLVACAGPIRASAARCCCSSENIPRSDRERVEGFHRTRMTAVTQRTAGPMVGKSPVTVCLTPPQPLAVLGSLPSVGRLRCSSTERLASLTGRVAPRSHRGSHFVRTPHRSSFEPSFATLTKTSHDTSRGPHGVRARSRVVPPRSHRGAHCVRASHRSTARATVAVRKAETLASQSSPEATSPTCTRQRSA